MELPVKHRFWIVKRRLQGVGILQGLEDIYIRINQRVLSPWAITQYIGSLSRQASITHLMSLGRRGVKSVSSAQNRTRCGTTNC